MGLEISYTKEMKHIKILRIMRTRLLADRKMSYKYQKGYITINRCIVTTGDTGMSLSLQIFSDTKI